MSNLKSVIQFVQDAKAETSKISWPERKQTVAGTIAVVSFVIVTSLFLSLTDFAIGKFLDMLLN